MARTKGAVGFIGRNRLLLIILGILLIVIVLAAFVSQKHAVAPIRAGRVERSTISSSITTDGRVEPVRNFEAHALAPALVKRVLVHQGDSIKAGQLLVQLDDAEARSAAARALAQLRSAEADLVAVEKGGSQEELLANRSALEKAQAEADSARRNLRALEALQKSGAAAPGEVQEARNRWQRAQADLELIQGKQHSRYSSMEQEKARAQVANAQAASAAASDALQHADIRSPQDGTVYSLTIRPGQFVGAGELLVQVASLKSVLVRAFVDEPEIGRLARGQTVEVTWDAMPGRTWTGRLTTVPTTVSRRETRTVGEVTVPVENPDLRLLPNINVTVRVITGHEENALIVPREAVHLDEGQTFVYAVSNGELKKVNVATALSNLTNIQVTSGISEGAEVALGTLNGQPLRPGISVRVVSR